MILTLVRHGETIENKEKIIMGQLDGTLSELGIQQAKKLAERLKDERFDYIFSSDLARAANTAKEIGIFFQDRDLGPTELSRPPTRREARSGRNPRRSKHFGQKSP